jgi:hypothetical protein
MYSSSFKNKAVRFESVYSHGLAFATQILISSPSPYRCDVIQIQTADQSDVPLDTGAATAFPGGFGGSPEPSAKAAVDASSKAKAKTNRFIEFAPWGFLPLCKV